MPIRPSGGVVGKYLEFPTELAAELMAYATDRGQTFRAVVMEACRRHLKHPPALPPDPADEPFPTDTPTPRRRTTK